MKMSSRPVAVGDTISVKELVALPGMSVVRIEGDDSGVRIFQKSAVVGLWFTMGTNIPWSSSELGSAVVLYLPGQAPRPERVVASEALRNWAKKTRNAYRGLDVVWARAMLHAARTAEKDASTIEIGE